MFINPYRKLNNQNPLIVFSVQGDVTGDGIPDNIYLTGIKTEDSPFIQKITLVIRDGRTNNIATIPLKTNAGYNPTIFLGDFTGNGIKDILISINSGGSGGIMYYYIYSNVGNNPSLLFDYETFNEKYDYEVIYRDYYKVDVINITEETKYVIDISNREKDYLQEIYKEDGTLKAPIEGFVSPLSGLYPIDFDTNGIYELLGFQRISGKYAADALGYIQTSLEWHMNNFNLRDQFVSIYGMNIITN
ncbi:MAG: VCBS repeat-containing protein [Epulopiscium sp.]|nr:VCBS repeat-containing protein [Candidatus Epulonipiscium sp.]